MSYDDTRNFKEVTLTIISITGGKRQPCPQEFTDKQVVSKKVSFSFGLTHS